ncbi:hypothetical protein J3R83DRAFT_1615 [Lanmaoa asiatica]|nr:hypothetical protein J3R83DRAFT_1615 [Lanmaoa asiatica]
MAIIFGIEALPLEASTATLNGLAITINALGAAGDIVIAMVLCFKLHMSRTGFQKSDTVITKLIVFSINTSLLTSLCALASLICVSVWPHAWIYIAFYYCIGRLYCNTLLATLNARKRLKGGSRNDDMSLSFQGHTAQQKTNHTMIGRSSKQMPNNISIRIDTTQEYIRDEYSASNGDAKNLEVV